MTDAKELDETTAATADAGPSTRPAGAAGASATPETPPETPPPSRAAINADADLRRDRIAAIRAINRPYWRRKARALMREILETNRYGVNDPPPPGALRGIDWHRVPWMNYYTRRAISWFAGNHGFEPDLIAPQTFSEKLIIAKLFAPIPLPSPGDKLGLERYIPAPWRDRVRTARRVWSSSYPEVPRHFDAPPGDYFFKANHASGLNIKVRLPLSDRAHNRLTKEATRFLAQDYGARGGEWWYQAIHRRIYLEESFSPPGASATDWKFFVVAGRVSIIQVDIDRATDHKQLIYDRDFAFTPHEFFYPSGAPIDAPPNITEMIEAAEAIGAPFEFARIDFYNTEAGLVLGEITLAPGGARQRIRSPELDEMMGAAWATPLFAPRP